MSRWHVSANDEICAPQNNIHRTLSELLRVEKMVRNSGFCKIQSYGSKLWSKIDFGCRRCETQHFLLARIFTVRQGRHAWIWWASRILHRMSWPQSGALGVFLEACTHSRWQVGGGGKQQRRRHRWGKSIPATAWESELLWIYHEKIQALLITMTQLGKAIRHVESESWAMSSHAWCLLQLRFIEYTPGPCPGARIKAKLRNFRFRQS